MINQEISNISTSTLGASDLITNKRSINTSVQVDNGQILVLGGLIENSSLDSTERVPLLSDIPFVGNAFKYQKKSSSRKNLMMFIRPLVLDGNYTHSQAKYAEVTQKQSPTTSKPKKPSVHDLWEEEEDIYLF